MNIYNREIFTNNTNENNGNPLRKFVEQFIVEMSVS